MYRHGQLPFWNPYIFSGTPLMADFNAGAFHPLTGLFVILPDRAAWMATEVILFSADRDRDVRLPPGARTLDGRLRPRCRDLRVRRTRAQPGQPRGHDRGVRCHPVVAVVGLAHRARRSMALDHRLRDRLRVGHPWRRARGDARRGFPRPRVCGHVGRGEQGAMVAGVFEGRGRHRARPLPGRHSVAAGPRGDPQFTAGERRVGRRRELPDAVQHPCPCPVPRRWLRANRRTAVLQPVQPARGRAVPRCAAPHRNPHPGAPTVAEPAPGS